MEDVLAFYTHYLYDVGMEESTEKVQSPTQRKPVSWVAHEYQHFEKNSEWFWALGLIGVAGAVTAIIVNNIIFAIVILIATFVLALHAAKKPEEYTFTLTQRGIRINDKLHTFQSLKSFSIEDLSENHTPKLILESHNIFTLDIIIPLTDVDLDTVHDFLYDYLPEEDNEEPASHKVMEWFGF